MGGAELGQQKAPEGGQKTLTGDIIGTPGKATQVAPDEGAGAASRNDPKIRPPEYAAMDPDCIRLLDEGRTTFKEFIGKTDPFWDLVDKGLSARGLQALTQTVTGARRAGLLPQISGLVDVYNAGSSWGIHFRSQVAAPAGWGKDYDPLDSKNPQGKVRAEHGGGDNHMWYRQPSGPGNPGMHLGTQEAGSDTTNLHWDPSNPMDHVSQGTEDKNNPLLAKMPNPFQPDAPALDALVPKGCAVYNPTALATHAEDIGWFEKHPKFAFLKHLVPAHAKNDGPNSSTEPFYSITAATEAARFARELANIELSRKGEMVNLPRGLGTANHVVAAAAALDALEKRSRSLAVQERTPATQAGREALTNDLAANLKDMYEALVGMFHHLHEEIGESGGAYETVEEWTHLNGHIYHGTKELDRVGAIRAAKKKAAP